MTDSGDFFRRQSSSVAAMTIFGGPHQIPDAYHRIVGSLWVLVEGDSRSLDAQVCQGVYARLSTQIPTPGKLHKSQQEQDKSRGVHILTHKNTARLPKTVPLIRMIFDARRIGRAGDCQILCSPTADMRRTGQRDAAFAGPN